MINKPNNEKGVLTKLLEQGVRIILKKECKTIRKIKIDIISSSTQIIKGEIPKINIIAEDINYKDLLFDQFELEANHLIINFSLANKAIQFKNKPIVKIKISLSQSSLKSLLLSNNWGWIGSMISKKIFNQETLEDIKIRSDKLFIKTSKKDMDVTKEEQINIKTERGKMYLENYINDKTIQIPIEDKIYIENITIENNLLNINANSFIIF